MLRHHKVTKNSSGACGPLVGSATIGAVGKLPSDLLANNFKRNCVESIYYQSHNHMHLKQYMSVKGTFDIHTCPSKVRRAPS